MINKIISMITSATASRTHSNPHVAKAQSRTGPPGPLEIVVNKRFKKGWRVNIDHGTGARVLSVPPVLADPPEHIRECLVRWALMPMSRKAGRNPEYVKKRRYLESAIRAYMESRGVPIMRTSRIDPKIFEHQTKGFVFDLQVIFDTLNRVYFDGEIKSYIRWGRPASRMSYQDVRMNKNGEPFNLITISGVYDSPKVPEYAIYGLVYHEMLHIAIPPLTVNGRRIVHGADFKAAMKKYPFWKEWMVWERENMVRLIMNARRRVKRAGEGCKRFFKL